VEGIGDVTDIRLGPGEDSLDGRHVVTVRNLTKDAPDHELAKCHHIIPGDGSDYLSADQVNSVLWGPDGVDGEL